MSSAAFVQGLLGGLLLGFSVFTVLWPFSTGAKAFLKVGGTPRDYNV